jgi:hypothetical protein
MVHGINYGSFAGSGFVRAKDSATTVICDRCGNQIFSLIYCQYEHRRPAYSVFYKMYEELASCMKNGFKLIHAISKLPVADLAVLQRVIITCKDSK